MTHSPREALSAVHRVSMTCAWRGLYFSICLKTAEDSGRGKDGADSGLPRWASEFGSLSEGNVVLLTLVVYSLRSILCCILSALRLVALSVSGLLSDLALVMTSSKMTPVMPSCVPDGFGAPKSRVTAILWVNRACEASSGLP